MKDTYGRPVALGAVGEEGLVCGTHRQSGVMAHTAVSQSKGGGTVLGCVLRQISGALHGLEKSFNLPLRGKNEKSSI